MGKNILTHVVSCLSVDMMKQKSNLIYMYNGKIILRKTEETDRLY